MVRVFKGVLITEKTVLILFDDMGGLGLEMLDF
jgi:hypothetical protein